MVKFLTTTIRWQPRKKEWSLKNSLKAYSRIHLKKTVQIPSLNIQRYDRKQAQLGLRVNQMDGDLFQQVRTQKK